MDSPLLFTDNLKGKLSYCGTSYFGFQKTKAGPSVEERLQQALEKSLQHPITLQAASRTDRGVHAEGQVVNFFTKHIEDLYLLQNKIADLLPKDISLLSLEKADFSFHPTLDAKGKEYHYWICNKKEIQLPFHQKYSWHFPYFLDLEKMHQAASFLKGTHDFSALSNLRYINPLCTIDCIQILMLPEKRLLLSITGNRFLYKMIRNIVGLLAYVGSGKIALNAVAPILSSKDRAKSGVTAPAHGLFLKRVFY